LRAWHKNLIVLLAVPAAAADKEEPEALGALGSQEDQEARAETVALRSS
jgi:hypothetical protein